MKFVTCGIWSRPREGQVFRRLPEKLSDERTALGGKVFDILGKISFDNKTLRELLIEAIRHGDDPKVIRRLSNVVEASFDEDKLKNLLRERALPEDAFDFDKVAEINRAVSQSRASQLQPCAVEKFFVEAFKTLGGQIFFRGNGRYEIRYVPAALSKPNRFGEVATLYRRICFDKADVFDREPAKLVTLGHPLFEAVTAQILKNFGDLNAGRFFLPTRRNCGCCRALKSRFMTGINKACSSGFTSSKFRKTGKVFRRKMRRTRIVIAPTKPSAKFCRPCRIFCTSPPTPKSLRAIIKQFVLPRREQVAADTSPTLNANSATAPST